MHFDPGVESFMGTNADFVLDTDTDDMGTHTNTVMTRHENGVYNAHT